MAKALRLSNVAANIEANALSALANSGYIRIYDGSQPATADTAVTTQNMLAELRFNAAAFGAASAGVITAAAIVQDLSANYSGLATWFRVLESDGATVLWDGSVGTTGCDLNLNSVDITLGESVAIDSLVYTVVKQ